MGADIGCLRDDFLIYSFTLRPVAARTPTQWLEQSVITSSPPVYSKYVEILLPGTVEMEFQIKSGMLGCKEGCILLSSSSPRETVLIQRLDFCTAEKSNLWFSPLVHNVLFSCSQV